MTIETTAGAITVRVPDSGYRIEAQTTVGSVNVNLDEAPDAEGIIEAITTTGNIDLAPG